MAKTSRRRRRSRRNADRTARRMRWSVCCESQSSHSARSAPSGGESLIALLALLVAVITVYLARDGYTDVRGERMSLLDCVYFAAVSLTTTGYGDVTPVTESARLTNILIITPLRVAFLVVLVGTTLQVLTERPRQTMKDPTLEEQSAQPYHRRRLRHQGQNCGRRDAAVTMTSPTTSLSSTSTRPPSTTRSNAGLVTVHGDATRSDVLRLAAARTRRRSSSRPAATTLRCWSP